MKTFYQAPQAEVVKFTAMQAMADDLSQQDGDIYEDVTAED